MVKDRHKNLFEYGAGTTARMLLRVILSLFLLLCSGWGAAVHGQDAPPPEEQPVPAETPTQEEAVKNPNAPCVQPAPMVRWQDYKGPFDKVVGAFGRKLERKSTRSPHYKPDAILCSLDTKDEFLLFVDDTIDPVTFIGAGFNAGIDQAENTDRDFGQGAAGYAKRFGAEMAGSASSNFFGDFVYPMIFSEDPRYYRLAHGSFQRRLLHAVGHSVVAHRQNGMYMFNFSEWLTAISTSALGDLYHPNNKPGVGPAAVGASYAILTNAGYDVLREFWPEIARKFKLPFRDERD
jgi:hypothetical protein